MRARSLIMGTIAATALVVTVGCSSTTSTPPATSAPTTTTTVPGSTIPKEFAVDTPDGQVSLSLNGSLPPNWPSSFPVPKGAEPAGSGSVGGSSSTTMVAVYSTSESAQDAFNFYKNNKDLTVSDASSGGVGKAFVGKLKVGGQYEGSVTVVGRDQNLIVIVLKSAGAGSGGTVKGATPGSTPGTTKGTAVTP